MKFRIADTFTDSLAKLTGDQQKVVKTTAFDLQLNPVNPGMQFHRIARSKDAHFWSIRAGSDIRLIVHKTDASLLLCYVDHPAKGLEFRAVVVMACDDDQTGVAARNRSPTQEDRVRKGQLLETGDR